MPLSDLLVAGATLTSYDGTVEFSEFSYNPTVNAPDAANIDVITDGTVPGGFRVQGAFQASNGATAHAVFGFDADVLTTGGVFGEAELALIPADSVGVDSGVSISERVDTPLSGAYEMFSVFDTPVGGLHENSVLLTGFGDSISVLKGISVTAGVGDLGAGPLGTFAGVALFSQNFSHVVPEPAGWLLLLGCGVLLARRR